MSLVLVGILSCLFFSRGQSAAPNIVFILVDDLGHGNIGFASPTNPELQTPNIDNLATKDGLILSRHYVHYCCSPTRSSFQSGRFPVHVNLNNADAAMNPFSGVPPNMTCIAETLKRTNYSTYMVGKWDAGSTVPQQIPMGRGYDYSFGYLSHANTYYTNEQWSHPCRKYGYNLTDLWETDGPAYAEANTGEYEELLFASTIYDIIDSEGAKAHAKAHETAGDVDVDVDAEASVNPFFLFYASHLAHDPMQASEPFFRAFADDEGNCSENDPYMYPNADVLYNDTFYCRSVYTSMVHLLDVIVGNITARLKANGLWENTLLVFTGDNGGCERLNICSGNSYPLRGGKFVPFEGGIRTVTFVSGGYLPAARRGQIENGMMAIADWYTTFCYLNGDMDCTDMRAHSAHLPALDGYNMWPLITGRNATSPRIELPVDEHTLIQHQYKLITNTTVDYATWSGLIFPNASSVAHPVQGTTLECNHSHPCLFDVVNDITEHHNIIAEFPEIAMAMDQRLTALKKGYYQNNEHGTDVCPKDIGNISCACYNAVHNNRGFYGPYQTLEPADRGINKQ